MRAFYLLPILLALWATTTLAQSLDPDLDRERRHERDRADNDGTRDGTGLRAGSFLITPELSISETFDSNVFLSPQNAVDTAMTIVSPGVTFESRWSRHAARLELGAEAGVYTHDGEDNYLDAFALFEGELDITRRFRLGGELLYRRQHEARGTDDLPAAAAEPVIFNEFGGAVQADIIIRPVRLVPFAVVRKLDFNDAAALGGGIVNQDDRDRIELEVGLEAALLVRRNYQGFLRGAFLITDYDDSVDDLGIDRDSTGFELTAGAEIRLSRLLQGRIEIGYEHLDFDDASLPAADAITAAAGLTWTPTRRIEFLLDVEREIRQTTVANASTVTAFESRLEGRYELLRQLDLSAIGRFSRLTFEGASRTDMIFGFGFAADWEISRNVTLSPGYAFEFRDSDAIGFDYRVHRVFLDLIYRF